jgi:CubicO group peptidase (beta-lactamase class C family)
MVVEKASGQSYMEYVTQHVAKPIGVTDLVLSPTEGPRLPGEVATYASTQMGLSPLHLDSTTPVPGPSGGDGEIREVAQAGGGLATSAESMLALMGRYAIWGLGPPPSDGYLAREGAAAGTNTFARQRSDGTNYAVIVNYRNDSAFKAMYGQIDRALDAISR